jgi:raffinose/stachyose/melibiose transport system substrate-binding protein
MMSTRFRGAGAIVAALACLALGACGSGGGASSGKTELTVLVDNGSVTAKAVKSVVEAFEKAHPDVDVKVNTRPQGSDGDNVVKTKLSTGDMEDVFWYNAGSLLQALDPEKTLTDLTNDPVALKDTDPQFLPVVTQNGKVYGAPQGTVQGGGILYNKDVYARLGLQVPKTWAEFAANNDKIKAAGVTPVLGTFKDTWTTQLFVLGDFHNVAVAQPSFAADYTANKVKYSTTPAALRGFEKTAEVAQKDWLNSGAGSATLSQGLPQLVSGKAAQYPILTSVMSGLSDEQAAKLGFFGIPGDDASKSGATVWLPGGQYIPKSTQHLDAAKQFVGFVASPAGSDAYSSAVTPTGPYLVKGTTLPDDALPVAKDITAYVEGDATTPALEYSSPVKGPALQQITTAVESGQTAPADAAAQYDADVTKQAKQLGLPGW